MATVRHHVCPEQTPAQHSPWPASLSSLSPGRPEDGGGESAAPAPLDGADGSEQRPERSHRGPTGRAPTDGGPRPVRNPVSTIGSVTSNSTSPCLSRGSAAPVPLAATQKSGTPSPLLSSAAAMGIVFCIEPGLVALVRGAGDRRADRSARGAAEEMDHASRRPGAARLRDRIVLAAVGILVADRGHPDPEGVELQRRRVVVRAKHGPVRAGEDIDLAGAGQRVNLGAVRPDDEIGDAVTRQVFDGGHGGRDEPGDSHVGRERGPRPEDTSVGSGERGDQAAGTKALPEATRATSGVASPLTRPSGARVTTLSPTCVTEASLTMRSPEAPE